MSLASVRLLPPSRAAPVGWVLLCGLAAVTLGAAAAYSALLTVVAVATLLLVAVVWWRPQVVGYLLIGVTPLVAGIDRGRLIPVLRPNEALAALLGAVLVARWLFTVRAGFRLPRLVLSRVEVALVLMAVASSILPMAWMVVRGQQITSDDISYAMVLWKYLAVYVLVRLTIRTEDQVRRCLWISLGSAAVVGAVGVLQALNLGGVRTILLDYYTPFGYTAIIELPRGGSTLSLPAATADLMVFNLALAIGIWYKTRRHAAVLVPLGLVFVFGTFAAAEFSSLLGLVVGMVCVAAALRRLDLLRYAPLAIGLGLVAIWPVVESRLSGFSSLQGVPNSWLVRWSNLRTYFWPELLQGSNLLLGVRPAARVVVLSQGTGYVWIESGYTWLLWGGGIPLFAAFVNFVRQAMRANWRRCQHLARWSDIAALGVVTAVVVNIVLMLFDPHLTYRGAADCLHWMLAVAAVGQVSKHAGTVPAERPMMTGGRV
ncbi:MAG: hypothetical protein ACXVXC_05935 [Nocardioidaceae bacterium]